MNSLKYCRPFFLQTALLIGCFVAISTQAAGPAPKPLKGNVLMYSGSLGELQPPQSGPLKMAFTLEGEAAQKVFLELKESADPCGAQPDTRYRASNDGLLVCTSNAAGKQVRCTFGLDVRNAKLIEGSIC